MPELFSIQAHGATHVGHHRTVNEDRILVEEGLGVFAVFDGMGGHDAGDVASTRARDILCERIKNGLGTAAAPQVLAGAAQRASAEIYDESSRRGMRRGMGSTVTACLRWQQNQFAIAHVGDSRAYLLRDGRLNQVTTDHSLVAELLANGAITPEEAANHPHKNILSRCLGTKPQVKIDTLVLEIAEQDRIVLCSDGLHGCVSHHEITQALLANPDCQQATKALIELALHHGAPDNVGIVVVDARPPGGVRPSRVMRANGATALLERRQLFVERAMFHGVGGSALLAEKRNQTAHGLSGELVDAIYHDLANETGIHVWRVAEGLAGPWLADGGAYPALRELFALFRSASADVVDDVRTGEPELAVILDTSLLRAFAVVELAIGGVIATMLRAQEAVLVAHYGARVPRNDAPKPRAKRDTLRGTAAPSTRPAAAAIVELFNQVSERALAYAGEKPRLRAAINALVVPAVGDLQADAVDSLVGALIDVCSPQGGQDAAVIFDNLDESRGLVHDYLIAAASTPQLLLQGLRQLVRAEVRVHAAIVISLASDGEAALGGADTSEEGRRLRDLVGESERELARIERDMATQAEPQDSADANRER